jgi:hypothetical protein
MIFVFCKLLKYKEIMYLIDLEHLMFKTEIYYERDIIRMTLNSPTHYNIIYFPALQVHLEMHIYDDRGNYHITPADPIGAGGKVE